MRLKLASALVMCAGTLVLTQQSAVAYPGDLAAGEYDNATLTAGFGYFNQTDFSNLSVNVSDTTRASKQVGGVWTSTETQTVQVDFFQASASFGGDGCYVLGPGQATIDHRLGTASLKARITDQTPTCDGGPGSIPLPFDVSMALTGNGPIRSSRGLTRESCLDYSFVQTTSQTLNPASGTATVTAFQSDAVSGGFSLVQGQEQVTHVQGTPHDSCPQQPGAVAGGAGPPNPGRYQTSSTFADATLFDASGSLGVTLTDSTEVDIPLTGPSTTTTLKQLNFSMYLNGVFASGCFNLSPSDYTLNGVQSAEATVNVDTATTCYGFPANMPPGQTLHVVWTNHSPVANFQFQGGFDCLTYHETGHGSESTSNPDAQVTLTPMLGTVNTTDNSMTVSSNQVVAAGKKQPECRI